MHIVEWFSLLTQDTIKKRLQAQTLQSSLQGFSVGNIQYKGMLDCCTKIYHTEGYRGFYKVIFMNIVVW